MNKTFIIIKREYLTRVTKKSFIILTLVMPIIMAGMMVLPAYFATKDSTDTRKIAVIDNSGFVFEHLKNNKTVQFEKISADQETDYKQNLAAKGFFSILNIPKNILSKNAIDLYSIKQINIDAKENINWQIKQIVQNEKRSAIYAEVNIPDLEQRLAATKTNLQFNTYKLNKDESNAEGTAPKAEKSSTEAAMIISYICGFIIYIFIFMYGSMVMRGVVEEKQNRIVEVIISSVKPIQLMMGKILGLVAVSLTQVGIWILILVVTSQNIAMPDILSEVLNLDMGPIIFGFVAYFILGYLLYSSLMAAIAAAVDAQEDMQQFMLPVMLPLILAIMILMNVMKSPDGALALWTSFIPFFSPIIMMARIPFGVEWWEIALSLTILVITTFACIWVAAKVYRTGILMYGKKPSWKEIGRWISYKN